jgi:hypothetical protein
VSQTVSAEKSADTGAVAYRVFSRMVFATPGQGDGLTSETVLQAQHRLVPSVERNTLLSAATPATAEFQHPDASRPPEIIPTTSLVGPALAAQPLGAGEEVFQSTHTTLQSAPGHTTPAVPWGVQATLPLTEIAVRLPTVPQTEVAAASITLRPRVLGPEDTVLSAYDTAPISRHQPESQIWAAETMPSVVPLATDSALPLASPRATSHIPSAEPASTVPPSSSLEDLGHP